MSAKTSILIRRIAGHAAAFPDKLAIVIGEERRSYSELAEQVRRLSVHLQEIGIGRGDHVGVALPNCIEFLLVLLAAADLGATVAPMSFSLPAEAIAASLSKTGCRAVIAWAGAMRDMAALEGFGIAGDRRIVVGGNCPAAISFATLLEAADSSRSLARYDVPEETPLILGLTSGSTGNPKPIIFSQRTKLLRSLSAQNMYGLNEADVILAATPMYHSLAQRLCLLPLLIGATGVVMPNFAGPHWIEWVEAWGVTFTIAVSSQLEHLLSLNIAAERLSRLKTVVSSSALLKTPVKQRLVAEWPCSFHECYGASEVGIVSNLSPDGAKRKLASVGQAAPGTAIMILDDETRPVQTGTIGEIAVRSETVFSGYWSNPEATRKAFHGDYFLTGDMGSLDEDGFLYFAGRKKDIIITGGINVYPADVEAALKRHPDVADACVIGCDDPHFGEAVLAVIIPREPDRPPAIRSLQRHCRPLLADYQQPRAFVFVAGFPRSGMGKIEKQKLKEQIAGSSASG